MKRILFIILAIGFVFFSGCSSNEAGIADVTLVTYTCPDGTVVSDVSDCETEDVETGKGGVYTIKEGVPVTVEGKNVKLDKINADGSYVVDVGGVSREIKQTKYTEIVNGLKIKSLKIDYSYTDPSSSSLELSIGKLVLGNNEYLFFIDKPQTVYEKSITLTNVEASDSSVKIRVEGKNEIRIREGYSKNIDEFDITNVDAFPRDMRRENYAILNIVKK